MSEKGLSGTFFQKKVILKVIQSPKKHFGTL